MPQVTIVFREKQIISSRFENRFLASLKTRHLDSLEIDVESKSEQLGDLLVFQIDQSIFDESGNLIRQYDNYDRMMPHNLWITAIPRRDDTKFFSLVILFGGWQMWLNKLKCETGAYKDVNMDWSDVHLKFGEFDVVIEFLDEELYLISNDQNCSLPKPI